MAYELIPTLHGALLRGILEDTYNNNPSVPNASTFFCPEGVVFNSFVPEIKPRMMQGPFLSGVKPSFTKANGTYSGDFPLALSDVGTVTLSPAASIAGVPLQLHTLLCGGGFVPTHSNSGGYSGLLPGGISDPGGGNDEILTYTYFPRSNNPRSSVKWIYSEIPEGGAETREHTLKGSRHGWTLKCVGGDEWVLSVEGMSLAAPKLKNGSPTLNSSYDTSEPIVGMASNYSLTKIAASAVTFGGGSEASPTLQADVYGLEISSNLTPAAKTASSGTYGVSKIQPQASTPTVKMTLDKCVFEDDFDVDAFATGRLALRFTQVTPMPGSTKTFIKVQFTGFVTSLSPGDNEGYRNTELELALGYPEVSSDGGGLVPDELMTIQVVTLV